MKTTMTTPHAPLFRLPMIAILRGIQPHQALEHVGVLLEEGWDAIEIPLNSPDWRHSIGDAVRTYGNRASIGGGTVLNEADVDTLAQLGGKLMLTPNTTPAVIRHAVRQGLTVVAGFATPSEAFAALDAGAQALKLFPAATFGPDYLRALRAVLPATVPVFAVGGVSTQTLSGFLAAGFAGGGIGGELYKPGQPAERTRQQARAFRMAYLEASP